MEHALELTAVVDGLENATLNSGAKASARSRFESTKQRFFGQLLLSMKLPTVIAAAKAHLAAGQSVVLQLVTTAESILDRRLGDLSPDERANLEIDLSPREYIIDYLERAFPTRQMRVFKDDTGTPRSLPMVNDDGHPVYNPEAQAARDDLIEKLCAMPPIMSALDALLEHFGHDNVAEVTGRTKRLITVSDGRQKLESRSARTSQAEAAAFMAGKKRMLVFSDAGGTGRSYHASLDVMNQEQRVHLLLEPGWRADRAIQGLGRTHRTHQATTPLFRPVTTDCKGELRFALSTRIVSTPTSSRPASRAAETRVSISDRNSSKMLFCSAIGRARMRLSQRWIGGISSLSTPSLSQSSSPVRCWKSSSVVLESLPAASRSNQERSAAQAYSLSRLSAGSKSPCPPVCRWPRVSAPRLSRRRAIVLVSLASGARGIEEFVQIRHRQQSRLMRIRPQQVLRPRNRRSSPAARGRRMWHRGQEGLKESSTVSLAYDEGSRSARSRLGQCGDDLRLS